MHRPLNPFKVHDYLLPSNEMSAAQFQACSRKMLVSEVNYAGQCDTVKHIMTNCYIITQLNVIKNKI